MVHQFATEHLTGDVCSSIIGTPQCIVSQHRDQGFDNLIGPGLDRQVGIRYGVCLMLQPDRELIGETFGFGGR
ncbi:hypothetical protein D3C85_1719020 [compost metagenome]